MKRVVSLLAWGLFLVTCALTLGAVVLLLRSATSDAVAWLVYVLAGPLLALVGALIATRQNRNPIGWLMLIVSVALAGATFAEPYAETQMQAGGAPGPVTLFAIWSSQWLWAVPNMGLALLLMLFPTGHFLSARWRVVGMLIAVNYLGLMLFIAVVTPMTVYTATGEVLAFANPIGIVPFDPNEIEGPIFAVVLVAPLLLALSSMLLRFRRARGVERQQMKWLLYAAALFVVCFILNLALSGSIFSGLVNVVALGLPIAIGIAILRYRLYDIDLIIRRTLTYGLLTALLLGVFAASIIVLQQVFASLTGTGRNELVTVLSTLAIAALFVPLRNKLQEWIDRRFNRKKYDAQKVLNDFSQTVRDETDLEKLTARLMQVVDETMQPNSVSVWLRKDKGA